MTFKVSGSNEIFHGREMEIVVTVKVPLPTTQ
jgi:hypothetical protein